jgi:hypothetical protein
MFAKNSLNARNIASHDPKPRSVFQLAAGALKTKIELFLFQPGQFIAQLVY